MASTAAPATTATPPPPAQPQRPLTIPKAVTLLQFPYVKSLGPLGVAVPLLVLKAVFDEYHVNKIVRGIDKSNHPVSAVMRQRQEETAAIATKMISQHYRRASIRVHPDRYGDEYMEEFEDLKESYQVLGDTDSRAAYVYMMLQIVEKLGNNSPYLESSHKTWAGDHATSLESQNAASKYATARQNAGNGPVRANFYLEGGGLLGQKPKMIRIEEKNEKSGTARLAVPALKPYDDFRACCEAVSIFMQDGAGKVHETKFVGGKLEKAFKYESTCRVELAETIRFDVKFPEHGVWGVWWRAQMVIDGVGHLTTTSTERHVDMTDPVLKRFQTLRPAHIAMARRRTGELLAVLQQLRANQVMARDVVESRYWDLHKVIASARGIHQALSTTLEALGLDAEACPELMALREALGASVVERANLDDMMRVNQRKESLKAFKQSIAAMIESGEAASWIQHVSSQDLANTGGEVNRLYQLLVEGKKANSLLLDSATLKNSSERTDMFSKKQCETLLKRSSEVEALMVAETDRMVKETQDRLATEKARREMEKRAQSMPARGTVVKIVNLQSKQELNGSLGVYMGLGNGDRYVVKLYGGAREVSLLKKNFEKWTEDFPTLPEESPSMESEPAPVTSKSAPNKWQCADCSFLHEGYLAAATECDLCGNSRAPTEGSFAATITIQNPTQTVSSSQRRAPVAVASQARPSKVEPKGRRKGTVWIRKVDVAKVIGPGGKNMRELMAKSGAKNMSVDKKDTSQKGMAPLHIIGSPAAVEKGCKLVKAFLEPKTTETVHVNPPATELMDMYSVKPSLPPPWTPSVSTAPARPKPTFSKAPARPQPSVAVTPTFSKAPARPKPSVIVQPTPPLPLSSFLLEQKACLKCKPDTFEKWLNSQDISCIADLADAVGDDDFVVEMQANGLKGFKKAPFKKAVLQAGGATGISNTAAVSGVTSMTTMATEMPHELVCPITYVLMVNDPVVARDGYTYEREAIEDWFARQNASGGGGVRSPMRDTMLEDTVLVSSVNTKTMALAFANANPGFL